MEDVLNKHLIKFVGRDRELNLLHKYLDSAVEENGKLVLIEGEAGVGKSRLLEELCARSRERASVAYIELTQEDASEPHSVFSASIAKLVHEFEDPKINIGDILAEAPEVLYDMIPALSKISRGETQQCIVHDLQMERDRLFETLYRLICRITSIKPAIVVFDGIQNIDRTSLQLLHYVARNINEQKLLLVVTYRPEELPEHAIQTIRLMNREKLYERLDLEELTEIETKELVRSAISAEIKATISLKGLTEEETVQLVQDALGKKDFASSLASAIYKETQGNPLFVLEILQNIMEEKSIITLENMSSIVLDMSKLALPRTMVESVLKRKARLCEDSVRVIELSSLFRGKFNYRLLEQTTGMDEEALSLSLDELTKKDILIGIGDEEEHYTFKNPKVKEVIRNSIPEDEVPRLSLKIAENLEKLLGETEDARYELALFFLLAKDWDRALLNLLSCVEQSKRAFAIDEAIDYSKKVLDVIDHFDKEKGKMKTAGEIQLGLADMLATVGEIDLANESYDAAINLARELEDNQLLSEALLQRGILSYEKQEWEKSNNDFNDAIQLAGSIKKVEVMAHGKDFIGRINWMNGKYDDAISCLNESIKLAEGIEDLGLIANCYITIGNAYGSKGMRNESITFYNEGLQIFLRINDIYGAVRVQNNLGCSYQEAGEFEKAIPHFEKCIEIAEKSGYLSWLPYGYEGLGLCKVHMNEFETASGYLEKGLKVAHRLSNNYEIAAIFRAYGIMYRIKKEWPQSEEYFTKAIKITTDINQPYYLSGDYFEYSKMLKEKGDDKKAIANLLLAKEIWTKLGAKDRLAQVTDLEKQWGLEMGEVPKKEAKLAKESPYKSDFVGRDDEISRLTKHIERALEGGGNFVFVEGEAGIGKTRLVNEVLGTLAKIQDMELLFGRCLEGATPYLPFVQALEKIESKEVLGLAGKSTLIEEIFLAQESGTLISHCTRRLRPDMDSDILTGMFTAVQIFIQDSFRTRSNAKLNQIRYGEQNIVIEHGDGFYLAIVISGDCSDPIHAKMCDIVGEIENKFAEQLKNWDGERSTRNGLLGNLDRALETLFEVKLGEEKKYKIDPKDAQEKVFDAIVGSMIQVSSKKPLVLFLDDIQWMDESSLVLMHHLAKKIVGQRIFAVGTFRPEDLDAGPDDMGVHPLTRTIRKMGTDRLYSKISLSRLGKDSVQKMIDSMFPSNNFSRKILDMIYAESGGNPFFTEEILASLVEDGIIYRKDDGWRSEEFSKTKLPTTVQDVILRRVDRLEKEHKKLLEYASVLGLQFDFDTILSVLEVNDDELLVMLDDLINFKLIQETRDGEAYVFDHSTIQEVVYENLSQSIKKVMHKKVAVGIEEINKNKIDDVVFDLAKHYQQTRDLAKAFEYTIKAAEKSESSHGLGDAAKLYEKSLEYLDKVFSQTDSQKEKLRIVNKLGYLHYTMGNVGISLKYAEISMEIAEKENNLSILAENFRNIGHIYNIRAEKSESIKAKKYFEKGLELSRKLGDSRGIADSLRGIGYILWSTGDLKGAIKSYESALAEVMKTNDRFIIAQIDIELGNAYNEITDYSKANIHYRKAIRSLEMLDNLQELARVYNNAGDLSVRLKDWDNAISHFNKCVEIAQKIDNKSLMGWANFNMGVALAHKGDFESAFNAVKYGIKLCEESGDTRGVAGSYNSFGKIHNLKGNYEEAVIHFNKAIHYFETAGVVFDVAESYAGLADSYNHIGKTTEYKSSLEKALELYKKMGSAKEIMKIEENLKKLN